MINTEKNLNHLIGIAVDAGKIIRTIRMTGLYNITIKTDSSPVTIADYQSNVHIKEKLSELYPDIPIVSEEDIHVLNDIDGYFFLIDPLDGTRDYIEGTNDYCINISLIYQRRPIFGLIYLPEEHQCYYAIDGQGSYKISDCNHKEIIQRLLLNKKHENKILTQTISKRSKVQSWHFFSTGLNIHKTVLVGSAKKFCLVAEGKADIYPRPGQTGEWDTASGDIIVTEAGGYVLSKENKHILYGKKDFLNEAFYAANFIL